MEFPVVFEVQCVVALKLACYVFLALGLARVAGVASDRSCLWALTWSLLAVCNLSLKRYASS